MNATCLTNFKMSQDTQWWAFHNKLVTRIWESAKITNGEDGNWMQRTRQTLRFDARTFSFDFPSLWSFDFIHKGMGQFWTYAQWQCSIDIVTLLWYLLTLYTDYITNGQQTSSVVCLMFLDYIFDWALTLTHWSIKNLITWGSI